MAIVLNNITSGYNLAKINANFQNIEDYINDKLLARADTEVAGEAMMERDLDMNGHMILNTYTDVNNPGSLLTVGQADLRYYNVSGDTLTGPMNANGQTISNLPTPVSSSQAVNKGYVDAADTALSNRITDLVNTEFNNNNRSLRFPDVVEEMSGVAGRANSLQGYNSTGKPVPIFTITDTADLALKLASSTSGLGGALVGWSRTKVSSLVDTVSKGLDVLNVSVWEFANLITYKPTSDWQTWDWAPALQALFNYVISYQSQTAVNAAMYGAKRAYIPAGVYPTYSELTVTKYGSSTGSLATSLTIVGDGMTASIIQPMTDAQRGIVATNCKLNVYGIGMRAGSTNQQHWVLGIIDTWNPAFHCHFSCVGSSGAAKGLVINECFDSTFEDLFIQNIADYNAGASVAMGISIEEYTGPANGGTAGDGSGDNSNQLTFIRPTVETANSNNAILFNISGRSSAFAHHAINVFGGHFETHNLTTKLYNLKNLTNVNFYGVVFSQNGSSVATMYRLGWIENAWNVNFRDCRHVTSNRLASYSVTDTLAIKVTGTSKNVRFINNHFISPYNDLSTYNRGTTYMIDSADATKGIRSYKVQGCTISSFTNKDTTTAVNVVNADVNSREHIFTVDASSNLVLSFSSDSTDTAVPTDNFSFSSVGVLDTRGNINIGTKVPTSATKGLYAYTNGDGTTVTGSLAFDNIGRAYLTAVSSAQQWVMGSTSFNPSVDNTVSLGTSALRPSNIYAARHMFTATVGAFYGAGSPEGAVTAGIGSTYQRTDGGANTSFYVKESGTGNTGWVAK